MATQFHSWCVCVWLCDNYILYFCTKFNKKYKFHFTVNVDDSMLAEKCRTFKVLNAEFCCKRDVVVTKPKMMEIKEMPNAPRFHSSLLLTRWWVRVMFIYM